MTRRIEGRGLERLQHEAMVSVSQHLVRRATLLHPHMLQRRRSRGRNVHLVEIGRLYYILEAIAQKRWDRLLLRVGVKLRTKAGRRS